MKKASKKLQKLSSKWSLKKPLYVDEKDKRYKRYVKQLEMDGFCTPETWSLYNVIAEFTLPRLKRFREVTAGYPGCFENIEEWYDVLDQIIFAFEWVEKYDNLDGMSQKEIKANWVKHNKGMKLFVKYFFALWW